MTEFLKWGFSWDPLILAKKRKGGSAGTDRQKLSDLVYVDSEAISQQKRMMVTVSCGLGR